MKLFPNTLILVSLFAVLSCSGSGDSSDIQIPQVPQENTYFPPSNSEVWDTKTLAELNWAQSQLQPLLDFLESKNTKGFIVLHNGKIVIEEYMNGHNRNSNWYWASAGKTLTTAISGIAIDEGSIDINNKVSDYLGRAWTSIPSDKEDLITNKHLLTMTSGLDDTAGSETSPSYLTYIADAGTRWAYHNVYVKMQDVVSEATNQTWNDYFTTKLKEPIGMNGSWLELDGLNVYWSNTRSMARFGLMTFAKGKWNNQQIVSEAYLANAVNTSQNINLSYGYLWWLNGNASYRLPQTQMEFNGPLITEAPSDMYAALGKNDQKIYIVPSKNLVVIRMGQSANEVSFGLSTFDNDLWVKINALIN